MLKSMTGYGCGESQTEFYKVIIEMKSVNHRFLELAVRLPKQLNPLEDQLKKTIQARLFRGKVDVFVTLEETEAKKPTLKVDKDLALVYHNSLLQLAEICSIEPEVDVKTIVNFPGIITPEKEEADLDFIRPVVEDALSSALDALVKMRSVEGTNLKASLKSHNDSIRSLTGEILVCAPLVVADYRRKLKDRVKELLGDILVDEARFANEVAFFADKADITEELARMESHLQQFEEALETEEAIGRKLEFILQEMNREANTIGSKANDLALGKLVIEIKSELEKMREQAQNIE